MNEPHDEVHIPGRDARTPWQLPLRAWKEVLKRCWTMNYFHNLSLLAAGVAFYGFLAITPLIASVVFVYGLFADADTVAKNMASIVEVMPPDAANIIEQQLLAIVMSDKNVTGLALTFSLIFSIYGAMRAAFGLIGALNIIYEERETRGFIRLTTTALGLTVLAVTISVVGLALASTFAVLQNLEQHFGKTATGGAIKTLTWLAATLLGCFGFAILNRYAPDRKPARWQWVTPGAVLATLLWLAVSFGFSLYVTYVSNYSSTYGSLAAIVVALIWLLLSSYAVLLGALLNAEAERQTSHDTTIGPYRSPGSRGAELADHNIADIIGMDMMSMLEQRDRQESHQALTKSATAKRSSE
jgi:membrane protein